MVSYVVRCTLQFYKLPLKSKRSCIYKYLQYKQLLIYKTYKTVNYRDSIRVLVLLIKFPDPLLYILLKNSRSLVKARGKDNSVQRRRVYVITPSAPLFRLTQADVAFDTSKISYSKEAGLFEGAVKRKTEVRLKHACP